ncbi:hypothetical protein L7F22_038230 [Adiantum nelumboides]|nr:hypothetical protein [Adiantum nelumboides]
MEAVRGMEAPEAQAEKERTGLLPPRAELKEGNRTRISQGSRRARRGKQNAGFARQRRGLRQGGQGPQERPRQAGGQGFGHLELGEGNRTQAL